MAVTTFLPTMRWAKYQYTSWSDGAFQGAYKGDSVSRVGVLTFNAAPDALTGKIITRIEMRIRCSSNIGLDKTKTLYIRQSSRQGVPSSAGSDDYVGALMGTLTGYWHGVYQTHILDANNNAALFAALKAYFEAGKRTFSIYHQEHGSSTSPNYLNVWNWEMTVTYRNETPTAYLADANGNLVPHSVYVASEAGLIVPAQGFYGDTFKPIS